MWEALMPLLSSTQIMTDAVAQAIIGTVNQLSRRRSELVALSRAERSNQSTAEPASKIRSCCTQMWCITAALTLKLLSTITQHSMLHSHNFHPVPPQDDVVLGACNQAASRDKLMFKDPAPRLSPEQLEKNFADINPPLTPAQALEEASRCLFCHDAPCIKACPTEIDVPQFIRQILTGNMRGSARTILEANILGHSCARVCPTSVLCEGACVLNAQGKKPVEIGKLQRYGVDPVIATGTRLFKAGAPNGYRIALVGAGPASLS